VTKAENDGMTCCVIALAMVYRFIDAWARGKAWFARVPQVARHTWHAPRFRAALALAVCAETAFAGGFAYQHRQHLHDIGARVLFESTRVGADLCRSLSSFASSNPEE